MLEKELDDPYVPPRMPQLSGLFRSHPNQCVSLEPAASGEQVHKSPPSYLLGSAAGSCRDPPAPQMWFGWLLTGAASMPARLSNGSAGLLRDMCWAPQWRNFDIRAQQVFNTQNVLQSSMKKSPLSCAPQNPGVRKAGQQASEHQADFQKTLRTVQFLGWLASNRRRSAEFCVVIIRSLSHNTFYFWLASETLAEEHNSGVNAGLKEVA